MPRATRRERIKKIKDTRADLLAKMQRLLAAESAQARKDETRLLILTGRMTLARVKRGSLTRAQYMADMDRFLTAPRDREFFRRVFAGPPAPDGEE